MKRRKAKKGFDCVELKRRGQAEIYAQIKGLSPEEEIAYFRSRVAAGPLGKLWKSLARRTSEGGGPSAFITRGSQPATHRQIPNSGPLPNVPARAALFPVSHLTSNRHGRSEGTHKGCPYKAR